jgi:hypothetical protein
MAAVPHGRAICAASLLVVTRLALAAEPPPEARPRLAVLELASAGANPSLAAAAGGVVGSELDRLGVFQVMTSEAIRALLAHELQKQILGGCAGSDCLGAVGGALGADYVVSGKVSALGGEAGAPVRYGVELTLSSTRRGTQEGQATDAAASEADLIQRLPRTVGRLTARLLAARSGQLVVAVSESGALVKVDDQARGTSPLPGPLELPSGPRALSVEKDGFVAWQADVTVHAGRLVEERVNLVPSPDFIRRYESRARTMRIGAWTATGVAVAGAAAAIAFQLQASKLYGNSTTEGTFLYYKQKLLDGAAAPAGVDYRAEAERLKNRMGTAENLSYAGMALAAAGAGAATWLWIAGDDPGRYARYRRAVALDVSPARGGAALALSGAF